MIFDLNSNTRGIEIIGDGEEYFFKTKLFSHSSKLFDSQSNVVASLDRSSWWKMKFILKSNNKSYLLHQRFSETELTSKESGIRFNASGLDFYNNGTLVSKVTSKGLRSMNYQVEITDSINWLALLTTTCLECSLVGKSG